MYTPEEKARIKWACRRGMLELDVVIMPFFEECFDALNEQEQRD
ncbi:succinate dehydrogenase assembly factor 2, partial [Escherichia coli]|nr:succinate dehydrogenase assembly factor 2 [Escherichia coli]